MTLREAGLLGTFVVLAVVSVVVFPTRGALQGHQVHYGGVVRVGPDWALHQDARHEPVGIKRLTLLDGCDLRVVLASPPGSQIVSALALADARARL